jgi:hypothetical protein
VPVGISSSAEAMSGTDVSESPMAMVASRFNNT